MLIPYKASDEQKMALGSIYNELMEELKQNAIEQFAQEGYDVSDIHFQPQAYVRFNGQLEDIKVTMPMDSIKVPSDMDRFVHAFLDEYAAIFSEQATNPEAGVLCLALGLTATIDKTKPELKKHKLTVQETSAEAKKGSRRCYFDGYFDTDIYDFRKIQAGNVIFGPAIMEHVDTNYVIPPKHRVEVDEYMTLWLKKDR
jgi:N-methylhydantoinase A